jgi:Tfp pilus assembly protein PilO
MNILVDTIAIISPGTNLEEFFLSDKDVVLTLRFQDEKGFPVFIQCLEETGLFTKIESFAKSTEVSGGLHRYDVTFLYSNTKGQQALNSEDFSKPVPKYLRINDFLKKSKFILVDSDLETLQRTVENLNQDIQRLKLLKKKLAEMKERLSTKRSILIRILEILPHHPVETSARDILKNLAGKSKIKFTQLHAGPMKKQKYYGEQFYTLKFTTPYASMLDFLQNIQKQKRLFHVNKLYFKPLGDWFAVGKLDVSLRLSTFFDITSRGKSNIKK